MSDDRLISLIADVLADHSMFGGHVNLGDCSCGWRWLNRRGSFSTKPHHQHVATVLAARLREDGVVGRRWIPIIEGGSE